MKKKALKIIAAVLAVVIAAGGVVAYAMLPHPLSYDIDSIPYVGSSLRVEDKTVDEVTVKKSGEDFKVLFFTDLHLDGKNKTSNVTVENLVNNIVDEKPDLVILNGDNVTSGLNRKRSNQFAQIFEKLGVYWAGGLGNHEGDNKFSVSRDEMTDIFTSYEHCLMLKGPEELFGVCNYSLVILNENGSMKHTYYFMDTGDEVSEETKAEYGIPADKSPYDGVKKEQVEWYTAKNNALIEKYGKFNSTVVIHIPLPQMKELGEHEELFYEGKKLEKVCSSGFDSGLYDAIVAGGTTKTVLFGHDHINNFGVYSGDINLCYLEPSGYGSYTTESRFGYEEKDWLQGYTSVVIGTDGTYTMKKIRNSEKKGL